VARGGNISSFVSDEGIILRQRLFTVIALAIISVFVLCAAGTAQTQSAIATPPLPSDAELDAFLSARNWDGLGAALSPHPGPTSEFARKLNWLQTRIDSGGGFFLALIYARNFWVVGNSWVVDNNLKIDPAKDPRVTAGLFSLYAFELIMIDGARCEDRSAPENRTRQLLANQAATLEFLKQQRPDLKAKIVDIAIAMERRIAPLRKDDDLVCRGGMEEMKVSVPVANQPDVPRPPGYYGRRIAVAPPPGWSPKFASPDVYGPMQDKARASMRENLLKVVGL
jgi:hypothetical protein